MKGKMLLTVGAILVAGLWVHPPRNVWCQSRPQLTLESEAAVLMDGITGRILLEKNPEKTFSPASLAKMMTLFLAFNAIKSEHVSFDEEVLISKKAWKMGGSQMFLEVGDRVKFIELIKGAAAISANDGALAIAEFLSGSEEVFVHQMNEEAQALGMKHTRFVNPHGLPREGQETSAMDMALLGLHYVREHPEALEFHTLPEYSYGGIKQKNWNPLLNRGEGVDGLKTGYLKNAGYHILLSAKKDSRRLIGVVMGAKTPENRHSDAVKLLRYGFKNFSTLTLVTEGDLVGKVRMPRGDPPELGLTAARTLVVTVPKGDEKSISLRKEIPPSVDPPITQGAVLGRLVLEGEGLSREAVDLVASQDVRLKSYAAYYGIGFVVVVGLSGFGLWWRRVRWRKRR